MKEPSNRREEIIARIYRGCRYDSATECWIWTGQTSGASGRGSNYPRMTLNSQTVAVHRVIYTCVYGYVPSKKQIDHKCRQRLCCNPNHLEMVSNNENQRRKLHGRKVEGHLQSP
jgi:hypothetical protein